MIMKKLILGFTLILGTGSIHGQDATSLASEVFSPRRIVKTNLAGYALLVVNANYEQKVGLRTSVGLMGGYKLPSTIQVANWMGRTRPIRAR